MWWNSYALPLCSLEFKATKESVCHWDHWNLYTVTYTFILTISWRPSKLLSHVVGHEVLSIMAFLMSKQWFMIGVHLIFVEWMNYPLLNMKTIPNRSLKTDFVPLTLNVFNITLRELVKCSQYLHQESLD